jgi:hypothetical protein
LPGELGTVAEQPRPTVFVKKPIEVSDEEIHAATKTIAIIDT